MSKYPKIINGIEVPYEKDISKLKSMLEDKMPYFIISTILNTANIKSRWTSISSLYKF